MESIDSSIESLKRSVNQLELAQQSLIKENEILKMAHGVPQRNGNSSLTSPSPGDSPMLRAERHLENSSAYVCSSPSKHRSRHQYRSDKSRHNANQSSKAVPLSTSPSHNNQSSPQALSDATQSSDNSALEFTSTKHRAKHSNRKSVQRRAPTEQNTLNHQTLGKDDLISAYSPVVDRQRHSSSASSGGPAVKSTCSPSRQSVDRPYGFHHVGASLSPSKVTQQWAVRSSFNKHTELTRKNRENSSQTTTQPTQVVQSAQVVQSTHSPAMKNLNFSLNTSPSSPSKLGIDKDEVLDKVRTGMVFSEEPEQCSAPTSTSRKVLTCYQDRLQLIRDAETRLDELLSEKRQLESSLTRMSTTHNRKDKQRQETIERQLDKIDKDLGSVRMTLRRYNAL